MSEAADTSTVIPGRNPRLITYRYLGTYSESLGVHQAEGWITLRSDLRGPVGLLAAPLGIALLDTAGINVDYLGFVMPTRIDLHVFEPALDVRRVHIIGRVVRQARSQFFTEGRLVDFHDRSRVIGIGSTHWAVGGPNPGYEYIRSGTAPEERVDLPPLYEVYGARRRNSDQLEILALTPELGGPRLHQGPVQVVSEAAAMFAATEAVGSNRFWIEHQGTSIVARGTAAPFVTSSEVLRVAEGSVHVRVELRNEGGDNRLCAVTDCQFHLA